MGLFSLIGGIIGGGKKKKASRKAEEAQIAYLQKGIDETARQFDQTRSDNLPFLEGGREALEAEMALLGLGDPGQQAASIQALKDSPLYQSLYDTGEEAVLANASATGGLRGGNTQHSLYDVGADTLASVIQQQIANLGGLRTGGMATGATLGQFGANKSSAIANLLANQGAARAGGLLTRGGINAQNWQNGGAFIDDAISSIFGGGGGGGGIGGILKGIF